MRVAARSVLVSVLTLLAALLTGLTWSMSTTAVLLSVPVALILGGTGTADPAAKPGYMHNMTSNYVNRFSSCTVASMCTPKATVTPERFWPVFGRVDHMFLSAAG